MPTDEQIQAVIDRLEGERDQIRRREGAGDPNLEEDRARVEEIRLELDQLWDLMRQRQALRDAGEDPNKAHERSPETIENYWQ
jgi:Protein of unknown function (DUF2630)